MGLILALIFLGLLTSGCAVLALPLAPLFERDEPPKRKAPAACERCRRDPCECPAPRRKP